MPLENNATAGLLEGPGSPNGDRSVEVTGGMGQESTAQEEESCCRVMIKETYDNAHEDTNVVSSRLMATKMESWPSFRARNSLVLSSTDEVKKTYDGKGDTEVLCLLALTPLGSAAISYTDPAKWNRFQPVSRLEATSLSSPLGIIQHLFMNTYAFNAVASSWYRKANRGEIELLQQMFSSGPIERAGNNAVYHGVVQMMVLDRLVRAMEEPAVTRDWNQDISISQSVCDASAANLKEASAQSPALKKAIESCKKWPGTFATFVEGWMLQERTKDDTGMAELTNVSEGDGVAIMQSLGCQVGQAANVSHLKRVESNFAAAALGLHALAQKARWAEKDFLSRRAGVFGDTRISDPSQGKAISGKSLGELMKYLGATDMDWLKGMDDATFLKPIYMAAVLSPLVLISEMPLVMNRRGKVPLYQLANLIRIHPLEENPARHRLEHQILGIVIDMASKGPSVFHQGISSLISEWSPILLGPDFVPSLTTLIEGAEKNHGDPLDGQMSPVLSARIEQLSDSASPPPTEHAQGSFAPPSMDYGQRDPGVSMGYAFTRHMAQVLDERNRMRGTDQETIAEAIRLAFSDAAKEVDATRHSITAEAALGNDTQTQLPLSERAPSPPRTTTASQDDRETVPTPPSPPAISTQRVDWPTSGQSTPPSPFARVGSTPVSLRDLSCAPTAESVPSQVGSDEESNGGERTDDDAEGGPDDSEEDGTNAGGDDDENPTSVATPSDALTGRKRKRSCDESSSSDHLLSPGAHSDNLLSPVIGNDALDLDPFSGAMTESPSREFAYDPTDGEDVTMGNLDDPHQGTPSPDTVPQRSTIAAVSLANDALGTNADETQTPSLPARHSSRNLAAIRRIDYSDFEPSRKRKPKPRPEPCMPVVEGPSGPVMSQPIPVLVKSTSGAWVSRWITQWPRSADRIIKLLEKMQYWDARPSNFCFEVSVDDWLVKSYYLRRMFFSLGCTRVFIKPDSPRPGSAFEWFSNFHVDMSQEREAHDCRFPVDMEEEDVTGSRLVMRRLKPVIGNINELHKYEEQLQNRSSLQELGCFDESKLVCLNFLDIPLQSLPGEVARFHVLDDFTKYAHRPRSNGEPWSTKLLINSLGSPWALVSSMSSYSDPHFDAAGYCTLIYIASGSKLWCHLPRGKPPGPGEDWDIKANGWVGSYLQAGDFMFMHPGTPHIVVTTGTCVTYGAHFYNMDVLHCTFAAMVADHFVGEHVVNTEHTRAPLLLFKGLDAILEDLFVTYGDGEWPLPERERSTLLGLAWLILLVLYMPQLSPLVPRNAPEADSVWQHSHEFGEDYTYVKDRARLLYELCCAKVHGGPGFTALMCQIETWAWDTVQRFQENKGPKHVPVKRRMKPVCICEMHCINSTSLSMKAPDTYVFTNMRPDEGLYRYPFIDTDFSLPVPYAPPSSVV